MPTVRYERDERESEGLAPRTPAVGGDTGRVVSNLNLVDHMGRFVAGELMNRYANEDLSRVLRQPGQVAVRVSWG